MEELISGIIDICAIPASAFLIFLVFSLYWKFRRWGWLCTALGMLFLGVAASLRPFLTFLNLYHTWISTTGNYFALAGAVALVVGTVSIYRSLRASIIFPVSTQALLLRRDIVEAGIHAYISSYFSLHLASLVGVRTVREVWEKHRTSSPLLSDIKVDEDGRVSLDSPLRRLEGQDKEAVLNASRTFLSISWELYGLYSRIAGPETAEKRLEESLSVAVRVGEDIALKAYLPIWFSNLLSSLLRMCTRETLEKIQQRLEELKADPDLHGIELRPNGELKIDEAYMKIARLSPSKGIEHMTLILTMLMRELYPMIRADLGMRADELLSKASLELIRKYPMVLKTGALKILPEQIEMPGIFISEPGRSYLVEEPRPNRIFELFEQLLELGVPGLCISTTYPDNLRRLYRMGSAQIIWLTRMETKNAISPTDLDIIRDTILGFAEAHKSSAIALDGLEYLTAINGFDMALRFLYEVQEIAALNNATLLVSISPASFDERQLAMIKRNMVVVRGHAVESRSSTAGRKTGGPIV